VWLTVLFVYLDHFLQLLSRNQDLTSPPPMCRYVYSGSIQLCHLTCTITSLFWYVYIRHPMFFKNDISMNALLDSIFVGVKTQMFRNLITIVSTAVCDCYCLDLYWCWLFWNAKTIEWGMEITFWMVVRMQRNAAKSSVMWFKPSSYYSIRCHYLTTQKYLGVHIGNQCDWTAHVSAICKKLSY